MLYCSLYIQVPYSSINDVYAKSKGISFSKWQARLPGKSRDQSLAVRATHEWGLSGRPILSQLSVLPWPRGCGLACQNYPQAAAQMQILLLGMICDHKMQVRAMKQRY